MNTYLAIITTALVITQIIRLIQNTIQLRRQEVLFKEQLGQLADTEVTKEDFDTQRKAYRLIVEFLERKCENDTKCTDPEVGGAETNEDRCVCCGEIIPEGRMVCPLCLVKTKENTKEEK